MRILAIWKSSSSYISIKTVANLIFDHLFVLLFKWERVVAKLAVVLSAFIEESCDLSEFEFRPPLEIRPGFHIVSIFEWHLSKRMLTESGVGIIILVLNGMLGQRWWWGWCLLCDCLGQLAKVLQRRIRGHCRKLTRLHDDFAFLQVHALICLICRGALIFGRSRRVLCQVHFVYMTTFIILKITYLLEQFQIIYLISSVLSHFYNF